MREVKICLAEDIKQGQRRVEVIHGRHVVIIHSPRELGKFFCIDAYCYHMGGPLHAGDIEDLCGTDVIQCPWHKHVICLEDGSRIDKDLNSQLQCKPRHQRVHKTAIDHDGNLWVKLTQQQFGMEETRYESDKIYEKNRGNSTPKRKGQRNAGPAAARRRRLMLLQQKNKLTNYFQSPNSGTMV